jgi:alkylated DNA repair protein alkB family protein 8
MQKEYAEYLLKKTKEDYNLIAEDFSRTRWNIWAEFSIFRDYVKGGDEILDIGCGNGRLLELLKGKNIEYIGVDNSERLIEIAKRRYPTKKFLVADTLNLPFPNDYFDKVFLIAVLHNIPSKELRFKALQEARRVLKPEGLLILTVWDIWRKETVMLILKHLFLKLIGKSQLDFKDVFVPWGKKVRRYYHYFTKRELINLVKKGGFKIKKSGVAKNETGKRSNIYLIAEK